MLHSAIITLRKRDYHKGDSNDITKLKFDTFLQMQNSKTFRDNYNI